MWSVTSLFAADLTINLLGWGVSSALATDKFYDLTGAIAHVCIVTISWLTGNRGSGSLRGDIAAALLILWAVRLGSFLFHRIIESGGDKRLEKFKTKPVLFLIPWMFQSIWVFLNSLPVIMANQIEGPSLTLLDWIALSSWLVGFAVQVSSCIS
jgi:steroid 5-alpha reductase family enzyme